MVSQDLIEILRCPNCVQEKEGLLDFYKETWFICQDCGRGASIPSRMIYL